ncbi:MAG: CoA transferase [Acidimicrobiia bacterium]|nr:CoA transferase [Acidimicrobiia bacterium]
MSLIELDLKDPEQRATFNQLVAGADVFIQNLSPAAAGRAGVRSPVIWRCRLRGYRGTASSDRHGCVAGQ